MPTGAFVPPTALDTSDLGDVRASGSTRNEFLGTSGGSRECVGALPPAAAPRLVIGGLPPVGSGLRSGAVVPDPAPGGLGLNPVGEDMSAVELGSRAGAVVPDLPTGGMGLTPASTAGLCGLARVLFYKLALSLGFCSGLGPLVFRHTLLGCPYPASNQKPARRQGQKCPAA